MRAQEGRASRLTRSIPSACIRTNLEPLRVPPFGRLFLSYTTNSIGDYVGLVALAAAGLRRDARSARHDGAVHRGAVPACVRRAGPDGARRPAAAAPGLARDLPRRGDRLPPARAARAVVLARAGAGARARRRRPDAHRSGPDARRGEHRPAAEGPAARGKRAASTSASRRRASAVRRSAGCSSSAFGVSAALGVDAATFAVIAIVLATCRSFPAASAEREPFLQARDRGPALCPHQPHRPLPDRRRGDRGRVLHADRADRDRLRGRDARDRRGSATASCCRPGARESCSAACCS